MLLADQNPDAKRLIPLCVHMASGTNWISMTLVMHTTISGLKAIEGVMCSGNS